MTVTFRTDGSEAIGFGHVARCRNLAAALSEVGYGCRFVRSGPRDGLLEGLDVVWIDVDGDEVGGRLDAEFTLRTTAGEAEGPPVVVADHYRIGHEWESVLRRAGAFVVAIDDLADRPHDCHAVIDTNPLPSDRYRGLVPPDTLLLLGLEHALLAPESTGPTSEERDPVRSVERVVVCFGGGRNPEPLRMMLEACTDPRLAHLSFDVVAAEETLAEDLRASWAEVERRAGPVADVRIRGWVDDLRGLLRASDISVGSGGSLAIERIRLGIPSVVITLADNQVPTSRELHRRGLLQHLGDLSDCTPKMIADGVLGLASDERSRAFVGREGPTVVDGRGAARCALAIRRAHHELLSEDRDSASR